MLMPGLFDEFFDEFSRPSKSLVRYNYPANTVMKTDVKESDGGYDLDIELPGYKKEDVKAELKEGYLTITASRNENKGTRTRMRPIRKASTSDVRDTADHVPEASTLERKLPNRISRLSSKTEYLKYSFPRRKLFPKFPRPNTLRSKDNT